MRFDSFPAIAWKCSAPGALRDRRLEQKHLSLKEKDVRTSRKLTALQDLKEGNKTIVQEVFAQVQCNTRGKKKLREKGKRTKNRRSNKDVKRKDSKIGRV